MKLINILYVIERVGSGILGALLGRGLGRICLGVLGACLGAGLGAGVAADRFFEFANAWTYVMRILKM